MARRRKDQNSDRNGNGLRDKPIQRNAANARERARMRVLSKAFSRLKTTLPWVPPDTKLSKLDTLRLAASYIAHLRQILSTEDDQQGPNIHPINLTWPFTFSATKSQESNGDVNDDDILEGEEEEEEDDEDEEDDMMECNGSIHMDNIDTSPNIHNSSSQSMQNNYTSTHMINVNGYYTSNLNYVQII